MGTEQRCRAHRVGTRLFFLLALASSVLAPPPRIARATRRPPERVAFRPSTNVWYQLRSTTGVGYGVLWGAAGDLPQ